MKKNVAGDQVPRQRRYTTKKLEDPLVPPMLQLTPAQISTARTTRTIAAVSGTSAVDKMVLATAKVADHLPAY